MKRLRTTAVAAVLAVALGTVAACGCFGTTVRVDQANVLPGDEGDGLKSKGKKRTYAGESQISKYLGTYGKLFYQYGTRNIYVRDYEMENDPKRTVTFEIYDLNSDKSAAGLFHYHRGKILRNRALPVEVGVEGLVDKFRGGRNLYFYKQKTFVKVIYTGAEPVPDLLPLAKTVAGRIGGTDAPPSGVEFLSVEGVDPSSWRVSPGYLFNYEFLSTAILAKAPGAGDIAEVFIIGCFDEAEAKRSASDYRLFLQLNGTEFTLKHKGYSNTYWWGRDPNQGRVVCTTEGAFLLGVLRPATYEAGEAVLDRLVEKAKGEPSLKRKQREAEKEEKRAKKEAKKHAEGELDATPGTSGKSAAPQTMEPGTSGASPTSRPAPRLTPAPTSAAPATSAQPKAAANAPEAAPEPEKLEKPEENATQPAQTPAPVASDASDTSVTPVPQVKPIPQDELKNLLPPPPAP